MHDGRVLRRSRIFARAERREILTIPTVNVAGQEIGPYLVGDSAYPLSPLLMKPFQREHEIEMRSNLTDNYLLRE